ncbi:MAG: geranylgeranyl reductase family protein [Candidatus Sumerlaeia bacterium]|nr:geranylgeranyl reductase family protein [Candidatus Sumerlaeia bacterium]
MKTWRLLDTGVRTAAENMALDKTVLLAHSRGLIPNTVRLLQFSPPAVLVGYHQCVSQEVREEFCQQAGIDINRRITGGGALLFNEAQLGWELIASADTIPLSPNMIPVYRKICTAVIVGLKKFGIEARFRPRNDIEVNGRKISGTGGTQEGNSFLFQGTLLLDFDITTMLKALMIPVEKLSDKNISSMAERITWLARELGYLPPIAKIKQAIAEGFEEVFGIELVVGGLTDAELEIFARELPFFKSAVWINRIDASKTKMETYSAIHKVEGGLIRAGLRVDERRQRLSSVIITGDFFIYPSRFIYDLECCLRDIRADKEVINNIVVNLWQEIKPYSSGLMPEDFSQAILKALEKSKYKQLGLSPVEANQIFTVSKSLFELLQCKIPLMLLPYCAKLAKCPYREIDDCLECGKCTVGEAYKLGKQAGMRVVSILNFEHLIKELNTARDSGVEAFIGCCCKAFYQKHYQDFVAGGVPGILIDIENTTCYELGKADEAYSGTFKSQTQLNLSLLKKVVELYLKNSRQITDGKRAEQDGNYQPGTEDTIDIIVVGAGPAGCSSAIEAVRYGASVLIVDKKPVPGVPVQCGEFIPKLLAREIILQPSIIAQRISLLQYHLNGDKGQVFAPGYIIHRDKFDASLLMLAKKLGAKVWTGAKVCSLSENGVLVEYKGMRTWLRAKIIIGADGPFSTVSNWIGNVNKDVYVGAQKTIKRARINPNISESQEMAEIYFSPKYGSGYAWFFPKGECANVGVSMPATEVKHLKSELNKFCQFLANQDKIDLNFTFSVTGGFIPTGGPYAKTVSGNIVLVGDAGGQTNPLTGAGIALAVNCGRLAGKWAARAVISDDLRYLQNYEEEWKALYGTYLDQALKHKREIEQNRNSAKFFELIKQAWRFP